VNPLYKLGILAVALAAFLLAYSWHGSSEYKRGRAEMAAEVNAKGKELEAANKALSGAKQDLVAQAGINAAVKAAEMEKVREAIKTLDDTRSRTIDRLRATASARASEASPAAGSACASEILRRQASDALLAEGQRLTIEGAGLLDAAVGLVGEGKVLLGSQVGVIELCQAYGTAVKLGQ
jgi:hypothetical protein